MKNVFTRFGVIEEEDYPSKVLATPMLTTDL